MATTQIKNGYQGGSDDQLKINPDGSINVNTSGGGGGGSNASVGPNGATAPTSSTELGAVDPSGNLIALSADATGRLNVNTATTITNTVTTQEAGLDSFRTSQYVVDMTEVQITTSALPNRSSISLKVIATGQNVIYFCQSSGNVATQGYPLYNGDSVQMDLTPSGTIYVVASAPGQSLYVLELA